jgi:V/A-type H+-transporting ATPase subunit K
MKGSHQERVTRTSRRLQQGNLLLVGLALGFLLIALLTPAAHAEPAAPADSALEARKFGFLAAALSVGLAALGGAYAVAHVGAAAVGAMSERPELAGRALIFVGLAEGIAIYGLILAVMILGRV